MANDTSGCEEVLIKSISQTTASERLKLAALSIVNRETYSRITSHSDADFSVLDTLTLGTSYDDFAERRTRLFEEQSFNIEHDTAIAALTEHIPKEAIDAWASCKDKYFKAHSTGLRTWIHSASRDTVTVAVSWFPPAGGVAASVTNVQVLGAEPPSMPGTLPVNSTLMFTLRRQQSQRFIFNVTVNAAITESVELPESLTDVIEQACVPLDIAAGKTREHKVVYQNYNGHSRWSALQGGALRAESGKGNVAAHYVIQTLDLPRPIREFTFDVGSGSVYASEKGGSPSCPLGFLLWENEPVWDKFKLWGEEGMPLWREGIPRSPENQYLAWNAKLYSKKLDRPIRRVSFGLCCYDPWAAIQFELNLAYFRLRFEP